MGVVYLPAPHSISAEITVLSQFGRVSSTLPMTRTKRTCPPMSLIWLVALVMVAAEEARAQTVTAASATAATIERFVLGPPVNSNCHEVAPVITPDGRTLFFHRFNHPENVGGVDGGEDIWMAVLGADGEWSRPMNVGRPLNTPGNNFVTSVSPDGAILYLGNVYREDGSMSGGLSVARRTPAGWSLPQTVQIDRYRNTSTQTYFALAPDGRTMIMEIDNPESMGLDDLFVSFILPDGTWSRPVNLGPVINTPGREITPYIAADGRTLYFSSDYRGGMGDQDVYMTRRLDDTWLEWSQPVNLGSIVNTTGWDAYFTLPSSGAYAYLVNYVDTVRNSDIVRVSVPTEYRPYPTVVVRGRVYDVTTGKALGGMVRHTGIDRGGLSGRCGADTARGTYSIVLTPGHRYELFAEVDGYLSMGEHVDLRDVSVSAELDVDIPMAPIRAGVVFVPSALYFDFARSDLRTEAHRDIDRVREMMVLHPAMIVEIRGHTDSIGADEPNYVLSLDRASAVAERLQALGIETSRITIAGYGRSQPRSSNRSTGGRQLNRRVEFTIVQE